METLPYLALKEIVQQLTPQDLARCSAVSRGWRDVFNQDWIWKSHCDPELEEPLRTIPRVAVTSELPSSHLRVWSTPPFETPGENNNSLSPMCDWRLAYMRENQLWIIWRDKELDFFKEKEPGNMQQLNIKRSGSYIAPKKAERNPVVNVEFLTDTQVCVFRRKCIEIFDVSKDPISIAKTNRRTRVKIGKDDKCSVVGTMLLVENMLLVKVYSVDLIAKEITLKHCISLVSERLHLVKEHFLLTVDERRSNLKIFDLNVGEIIKEEPFPIKENKNENVRFFKMRSFSNSDLVAVAFIGINIHFCKYYIYNIKQFIFLADLVIDVPSILFITHRHWMVYQVSENVLMRVYNIQTRQVHCDRDIELQYLKLWDNNFIFLEGSKQLRKTFLKQYSPEQNTISTIFESGYAEEVYFVVINKKALIIWHGLFGHRKQYLWKHSNNKTVMKFKLPFHKMENIIHHGAKVNQSFTRTIFTWRDHECFVLYSW